jgi:hypothetical protein
MELWNGSSVVRPSTKMAALHFQDVQLARGALVEELRAAMAGFCNASLERLLNLGIAYHHAGLTLEERVHVESGYRAGTIKATS